MHKTFYFSVLLIFNSLHLFGYSTIYDSFENIHLSPGASVVSYFIQDNKGLIWIGSDKGLYSFDGYSSRQHFTIGEKNNSRIYCGLILDDSYLLLGSDNGLLIYNYLTDQYREPEIRMPTDIRAMIRNGNDLWIGTLSGLYLYDLSLKSVRKIHKKEGLPHETIYSLLLSQNGTLYVGTYDGLCRYDSTDRKFEPISVPGPGHRTNTFINALYEDAGRKCIWIGTEGNLYKHCLQENITVRMDIFQHNSVKSLALDSYHNLLIGTDNGLYIYKENEPVRHIVHDSRNNLSLSDNIIWNIFTDRENNIWFATDYGISLSRFRNDFRFLPLAQITGSGEGNHFYSLYKDSKDNFWFGGSNGIIRITRFTGKKQDALWYKMGNPTYPLSHNRIRHIMEDRDNNLWIATDGGINRYDYSTRRFINYNITDSTGTFNCNWAYHILEDDAGNLWIASCLGGIFIVNKEKLINGKPGTYKAEFNLNTENGLSGMFISRIVPDHEGNIWALFYNNAGIDKINMETRKVSHLPTDTLIGENNFNYITCDQSGNIWLGYRTGLAKFTPGNDIPQIIRINDYSHYDILSIEEINESLWISRTDGIWVLNKETLNAQRLKIMNNVFTSVFYDPVTLQIYLGTVDGVVITSPEILKSGKTDRPIFPTTLYVNNIEVTFDENISSQSIRYTNRIVLNHKQNNISIEVSDLPYAVEEKNIFIYRLKGLDSKWNMLKQNTNRITLNNLNSGDYQLIVSKLDVNGVPSDDTYTLNIRINPPWYLTTGAKFICFLLIICFVIWLIYTFRINNFLKTERLEKQKLIEQSQLKINFFTELSKDLSSPLSHIVAPISKMLLEIEDPVGKKQLEELQHNALEINSFIHQKLEEEIHAKALLEQLTGQEDHETVTYDENFVYEITKLIEEHICDPHLNVNALCVLSGTNNKQLYRKIKQMTGLSPVEYIKTIRMKKAAMLLKQKKYTVSEVMYMVGYSNHSYFSKCFQAEFYKTPKQYMDLY